MVPAFVWPTDSRVVYSGFTDWRSYGQHNGIDIVGLQGEPVRAIAAGRVVFMGWAGSAGLSIWVDHGSGWRSHYCHLSSSWCRVGEDVGQGQRIATVGSTGASTGPHLHLNLFSPTKPLSGLSAYVPWAGKWAVDPLHYLQEPEALVRKVVHMVRITAGPIDNDRVYSWGGGHDIVHITPETNDALALAGVPLVVVQKQAIDVLHHLE